MKNNRRVTTGIAVVVGGLLLGSTALAAQRGEMRGAGRETHSNEVTDVAGGDLGDGAHVDGTQGPEHGDRGVSAGAETRRGHRHGHGDGPGHGVMEALDELIGRGEIDSDTLETLREAMKKMHEAHEQSRGEGAVGGEREHMEKLMAELVSKGAITTTERDVILEKLAQLAMRPGRGESMRGEHGGADRGTRDAKRDWMSDGRGHSGAGARGLDEAEDDRRGDERP